MKVIFVGLLFASVSSAFASGMVCSGNVYLMDSKVQTFKHAVLVNNLESEFEVGKDLVSVLSQADGTINIKSFSNGMTIVVSSKGSAFLEYGSGDRTVSISCKRN